ncbi:MAG TPA: type II toxin-antitoxin system VapC family toxin [Terriglobia bacterium]|nr:type II toxin-antitoxin system VapC family toxin [Terriglobia bacterium]
MIFDTDIVIWVLRNHPRATEFVDAVPFVERNLSAISYLELLYGCRNSGELTQVRQLVTDLFAEVIPLTEAISDPALRLMEQFVLSRRPGSDDVLIAATALNRGEALATGNLKHFDFIPGLEITAFRP